MQDNITFGKRYDEEKFSKVGRGGELGLQPRRLFRLLPGTVDARHFSYQSCSPIRFQIELVKTIVWISSNRDHAPDLTLILS